MRDIPDALAARIEAGAASLCNVWIVARRDGLVVGCTDHDRDLVVGGVTCRAQSGWTAGAAESETGFNPGTAVAEGVLDDAAITEADVAAGLWDGASVELWRVDWRDPQARVLLRKDAVARVRREGARLIAETEGPAAALDRVTGRLYGRGCDAALFDARCRVDPDDPRFSAASCDKRYSTCVGTFANGANFQGFPDLPGDVFLTLRPVAGETHDGGSRR